jgi:hypothetical protein
MTTVAVAMDQAIARSQEVKDGYDLAIVTEETHIQLCQDYLDGKKGDHPFSEPDLRDEIARGWKTVALIRGEINKHSESVNALRKKLDEAIREPVEMVINLTGRKEGEIRYEHPVQSRGKSRDHPDS